MSMALGFLFGQTLCLAYVVLQLKAPITNSGSQLSAPLFIRRHWRFPAFSLPADSLSSFGALLPVALIGSKYGAEAAGQVALTIRVLAAPVGLLGKAVQDVFKREAVLERAELGSCKRLFFTVLLGLLPIIVAFVLTLTYVGPAMFVLFFGEEWRQAGDMSKTLAPVYAIGLAASPLSYIVYLVDRQYVDLIWQAFLVVFIWLSLTQTTSLAQAVSAYTFVYVGMYFIYLLISYKLCAIPRKGMLSETCPFYHFILILFLGFGFRAAMSQMLQQYDIFSDFQLPALGLNGMAIVLLSAFLLSLLFPKRFQRPSDVFLFCLYGHCPDPKICSASFKILAKLIRSGF